MEGLVPSQQLPYASPFDKKPPRPAPTKAYHWREYSPNATLQYLRTVDDANRALANVKIGPMGFDLEWKPTFGKGEQENPVALVQLANDESIFLIQVSSMRELPWRLVEILENPAIIKAGVGIHADAMKLWRDYHGSLRSVVELSLLARTVDNDRWKGKYVSPLGLARLIEAYPYRLMEKGKTTTSNWEGSLNETQKTYAANDAYAGYMLYNHLMTLVDKEHPQDPEYYTFNFLDGQYTVPSGEPWIPHNPHYDPGPPPPPRIRAEWPRVEPEQDSGASSKRLSPKQQDTPLRQSSLKALARATQERRTQNQSADSTSTEGARTNKKNARKRGASSQAAGHSPHPQLPHTHHLQVNNTQQHSRGGRPGRERPRSHATHSQTQPQEPGPASTSRRPLRQPPQFDFRRHIAAFIDPGHGRPRPSPYHPTSSSPAPQIGHHHQRARSPTRNDGYPSSSRGAPTPAAAVPPSTRQSPPPSPSRPRGTGNGQRRLHSRDRSSDSQQQRQLNQGPSRQGSRKEARSKSRTRDTCSDALSAALDFVENSVPTQSGRGGGGGGARTAKVTKTPPHPNPEARSPSKSPKHSTTSTPRSPALSSILPDPQPHKKARRKMQNKKQSMAANSGGDGPLPVPLPENTSRRPRGPISLAVS